MTIGFHSLLPPARTGVAGYSAALLGALRRRARVSPGAPRADIHLYHLGNNQLHRGIYFRALARPGVTVLHDAVLHHFFLGAFDEGAYIDEFVFNYGGWHRDFAAGLWRDRARSGADPRYFDYPMLRRIAEAARAIVVHNPAAARMVLAHAPGARIAEIPHLFAPPELPPEAEILRLRERHGLAAGAFAFAVLGYLRESKRLFSVLRAFVAVRRARPDAMLLVAGEFASRDLARALAPLLDQPGIVRVNHAPERTFWPLAASVDACVNLRYPSAGETSGITVRLMGLGKPVIVTDCEENSRFPEDACIRVPHGLEEIEALAESMIWLARFPESAREIGRRAAAHIREHHALDSVTEAYWNVLSSCRD